MKHEMNALFRKVNPDKNRLFGGGLILIFTHPMPACVYPTGTVRPRHTSGGDADDEA
jgi:hypothetical protein